MLQAPAGPGIRLDSGVYEGWTVPIDYDPLLAKLVGYGQDRTQAVTRLLRALDELFVAGIKTNVGLFRRILADEDFRSGKIDTGFLERLPGAGSEKSGLETDTANVAAIAAAVFAVLDANSKAADSGTGGADADITASSWRRQRGSKD